MPNMILPTERMPYVDVFEARFDRFDATDDSHIDATISRKLIEAAETYFPLERYGRGDNGVIAAPPVWEIRITDKKLEHRNPCFVFHIGSDFSGTMLNRTAIHPCDFVINSLKIPYVSRKFAKATTHISSGFFIVEIAQELSIFHPTVDDILRYHLTDITEKFAILYGELLDRHLPTYYITYDVKFYPPKLSISTPSRSIPTPTPPAIAS